MFLQSPCDKCIVKVTCNEICQPLLNHQKSIYKLKQRSVILAGAFAFFLSFVNIAGDSVFDFMNTIAFRVTILTLLLITMISAVGLMIYAMYRENKLDNRLTEITRRGFKNIKLKNGRTIRVPNLIPGNRKVR